MVLLCETHISLDIRRVFLFSLIYIPDDKALSSVVILRQLFLTIYSIIGVSCNKNTCGLFA